MEQCFDIVVVGAGPAGASAAASLAEAGFKVILVEKAGIPRPKPCAGGLVIRGFSHLPSHVLNCVERYCHETVVNVMPAGLCFVTKKTEPILAMVMREDFDRLLVEAAMSAGATVVDRCEIKDIRLMPDKVTAISTRGAFAAKYLIGADGALSKVARKAMASRFTELVPAIECEIEPDSKAWDCHGKAARFDMGFVPQGYGWIFPKKRHLSVGVGRMVKGQVDLTHYLKEYLHYVGLSAHNIFDKKASVISFCSNTTTFARNRVLLVGDAAGLADPLTAEGISNAALSGRFAAKAIVRGYDNSELVARHYISMLESRIMGNIRVARKIARWVYGSSAFMSAIFTLYGERICEGMMEVMSGRISYARLLSNPLTYLRPFRLGGRHTTRTKIDKRSPFR